MAPAKKSLDSVAANKKTTKKPEKVVDKKKKDSKKDKSAKKEKKAKKEKSTDKAKKKKEKEEKKEKKKEKKEKKAKKKAVPDSSSSSSADAADSDDELLIMLAAPPPKQSKAEEVKAKSTSASSSSHTKLNVLTCHVPSGNSRRLTSKRSNHSSSFTDRVARALQQPLFMVKRERISSEDSPSDEEVFTVLGSTGNVYQVTIGIIPSCSCPDHQKGNICKHLIFVMIRVLGIPQRSELLAQTSLLSSEVDDILEHGKKKKNLNKQTQYLANEKVRKLLAGEDDEEESEDEKKSDAADADKDKARNHGDDCAVCFEALAKNYLTCAQCRNAVHKQCWSQYQVFHKNNNSCVFCRGQFATASSQQQQQKSGVGGLQQSHEGFQNVGALQQGTLRHRDTSTYNSNYYDYKRRYGYW